MSELPNVRRLIAAHINAIAEHDRLFNLNDWKLVDDATVCEALRPIDDALVAICAARPAETCDIELRQSYIADHAAKAIDGCPELIQRVIVALVDYGGQPQRMVGGDRP